MVKSMYFDLVRDVANKINKMLRKQSVVELCTRYTCKCGNEAYFHPLIGAAILWCEDCGVIASQRMARGKDKAIKHMTREQFDEFVKAREED